MPVLDRDDKAYFRIFAGLLAGTALFFSAALFLAGRPADIMPPGLVSGTADLADSISGTIDDRQGTGCYIFVDRNSDSIFFTPVEGRISSRFGWRNIFQRMHYGLDIAAPTGTPVFASMDGKVTFANRMGRYGLMIEIDHDNDVVTRYGHCNAIMVRPGEYVSKGEMIGEVGSTGFSTGPHLHFEVRIDGIPIDPEQFIM